MKRTGIFLGIGLILLTSGTLLLCLGFTSEKTLCLYGAGGLAAGVWALLAYISASRIFICKECYLRFEAPLKSLLLPPVAAAGNRSRRLYCPKCKKKTLCKGKKISIRAHVY